MPRLPTPPKPRQSTAKPALNQRAQAQLQQLFMQGVGLHQEGKLDQAKVFYELVIQANPQHFDALHLLGVLASQSKQDEAAVELIDRAIQINPRNEAFHSNRGIALKNLGRLDAALESFDKAIRIKPNYAEAYCNKGAVLHELRQLQAALASYDKALQIRPNYLEAHSNRGAVLRDLKRLGEAIASFDKAIRLKADYADAHWNKGLALLLAGDWESGLALFEWRWKRDKFTSRKQNFQQPLWLGAEPLQGKTILLHCEQGLGDTLQFCRYARQVKALGAHVVLEVQASLVALAHTLQGVDQVLPIGAPLPAFDYHCPLMSLPLAFKTTQHQLPNAVPYLHASPDKVALWERKLGSKTKPRVGLVWSGSVAIKGAPERSIQLEALLPHLPESMQYVCLQKELREVDTAAQKNSAIHYFGEEIADFTDTAALCELMDLVISIDTSTAHLAGALGKPTWVLLAHVPDWRWLLDREDNPWYPSARLFRQSADTDWSGVLQRIGEELKLLRH